MSFSGACAAEAFDSMRLSLSLMYMNDQSHLFGRYQSKSSAVCACALFVCPTSVPTFVNEIGPRHKRDRLADDNDFY